jgi:excisionase family DNA binding protein
MAGEPDQHTTVTVPQIAKRLGVCEETVYAMLKAHEIPNLRHGHRFIVSRAAYEHWEATIGQHVDDIHDKADESCARRREQLMNMPDLKDLLNPD